MKYEANIAKYPFISLTKDCKQGDQFKIIDSGVESTSRKFVNPDGTPKISYNFGVETASGEIRTLSFNRTSMNNCAINWGTETEGWVGRFVEVGISKGKTGMMFMALMPVQE